MRVLFVGDSPSKKNVSQYTAFVGTRSGETLKQWASQLGVEYYAVNSHDPLVLQAAVRFAEQTNQPVITLGETARTKMQILCQKYGYSLNLIHMPHPSPKNRKLNDGLWVAQMLQDTKAKLCDIKNSRSGVRNAL